MISTDLNINEGTAAHVFHFVSNMIVNPRVRTMNERHRDGTLNVTDTCQHWTLGPAEPFIQCFECHFTTEQTAVTTAL